MNALEQRQHRTVTQELDRKLTDVAVVVEALSVNADVLHRRQTDYIERVRALETRLQGLEAEQRSLVAYTTDLACQLTLLDASVAALIPMLQIDGGFSSLSALDAKLPPPTRWGRLRWLLTGH